MRDIVTENKRHPKKKNDTLRRNGYHWTHIRDLSFSRFDDKDEDEDDYEDEI